MGLKKKNKFMKKLFIFQSYQPKIKKVDLLLYSKLVGMLIKKGKRIGIKKSVDSAFVKLSKTLNLSISFIFYKLFTHLNTFVEVKQFKKYQKITFIPFSVTTKRRYYLVIKWLIQAIRKNQKKKSLSSKIFEEVVLILENNITSSMALRLKRLNNRQAFLNRSNMHFRW